MPTISSITPATFDSGRSVTLAGSGFGASAGQVFIGGVEQSVTVWSNTSITFTTSRGSQSMGACLVDVSPVEAGYTPTVIVTNQSELDTELAKSAATLEGAVIGVQYNATAYTITATQLNGKSFGTSGLVICGYGETKPVFSKAWCGTPTNLTLYGLEIHDASPAGAYGLIEFDSGASNLTISHCVIHGKYYAVDGDYSGGPPLNYRAINFNSAGISNVSITENEIYDTSNAIVVGCSGTLEIVGNTIYRMYEDAIKVVQRGQSSTSVNWNVMYNGFAAAEDPSGPHCDLIQFLPTTPSANWGGIEIIGNRGFIGEVPDGIVQGIFLSDMASGYYYTATIKGNLMACYTNYFAINGTKDCVVIGNTIVPGDLGNSLNATILMGNTSSDGGNVVKNNVYRSASYGSGTTQTNNHAYTTQDLSTLSALFDGTAFTKSDLNSLSAVMAAYSMKTGGSLDQTVNIGAVGSGYVDYVARTINGAME